MKRGLPPLQLTIPMRRKWSNAMYLPPGDHEAFSASLSVTSRAFPPVAGMMYRRAGGADLLEIVV
jgi:hypothetical protein